VHVLSEQYKMCNISHFGGGLLVILICATHCPQNLPFQVLVYGFDSKFELGTVLIRHVVQMRLQ